MQGRVQLLGELWVPLYIRWTQCLTPAEDFGCQKKIFEIYKNWSAAVNQVGDYEEIWCFTWWSGSAYKLKGRVLSYRNGHQPSVRAQGDVFLHLLCKFKEKLAFTNTEPVTLVGPGTTGKRHHAALKEQGHIATKHLIPVLSQYHLITQSQHQTFYTCSSRPAVPIQLVPHMSSSLGLLDWDVPSCSWSGIFERTCYQLK